MNSHCKHIWYDLSEMMMINISMLLGMYLYMLYIQCVCMSMCNLELQLVSNQLCPFNSHPATSQCCSFPLPSHDRSAVPHFTNVSIPGGIKSAAAYNIVRSWSHMVYYVTMQKTHLSAYLAKIDSFFTRRICKQIVSACVSVSISVLFS